MGLKFKNQNPISDNNTLKVYFCTQTISDDPNDPYTDDDIIMVYHIAATTLDEAVDIWIENYSNITWKDKTREDFTIEDIKAGENTPLESNEIILFIKNNSS